MRSTNFFSNFAASMVRPTSLTQRISKSKAGSKSKLSLAEISKKLVALAVSYELISYGLATVQAIGLTLPAIVNGGPAQVRFRNEQAMQNILSAAQQWQNVKGADRPSMPTLEELKAANASVPACEGGCHFEFVRPGQTMKAQNGQFCLVPEGRLAIRSVIDSNPAESYGLLSNPY